MPSHRRLWYTIRVETATPTQHYRCQIIEAGTVPYAAAWQWQRQLVRLRSAGELDDMLLLLEHPPTITLGRAAARSNVLADAATLAQQGIALVETDRGGDVTYHAPGQLVGYPILKLSRYGGNLLGYLRRLEDVIIRTLAHYGIAAGRVAGLTGVWLNSRQPFLTDPAQPLAPAPLDSKIAAIGVRLSASGVTSHGFALNIAPDLYGFTQIVPCGIQGRGVTSMQAVLGEAPPYAAVRAQILHHFTELFQVVPQQPDSTVLSYLARSNNG